MRALCVLTLAAAACGEAPHILIEPLTVVSWTPNRGAQCVAATREEFQAVLTFSDQLDASSITPSSLFVRREGSADAVSGDVESAGATATLRVRADLAYETAYELVAAKAISGVERGELAQELVSPFMTVSAAGCF
jgi:hypothetical protein